MTAQIHDKLTLDGRDFDLVALEGDDLPSPMDFGMYPRPLNTACWRGYHCAFLVDAAGYLVLDKMTVGSCREGYLPVNGVLPPEETGIYDSIGIRTTFTGKLQVGGEFLPERYIHMGFHPASAYQVILQLTLEEGRVISVEDLSVRNEAHRDDDRRTRGDLMGWIRDRFALDLRSKGVPDEE